MRVDEHTIELDGSPAFYRAAPVTGTPRLYLHGVPTSSEDWVPFLERAGGVAPDLIGFGRSAKPGHLDYTVQGLANFVERLLAELAIDQLKLVGHDWGTAVAVELTRRRPARIERIVLCNPIPLVEGFSWHRYARLWRRPVIGELAMGATNRWLLARGLREGGGPTERIASIWEQFDQGTQRAILRLYRSAPEPKLVELGNSLAALQMPALVIWGERDPWLPVRHAEPFARKLPRATLDVVPGAGHWPWLDDPAVIDRVMSFLET